MISGIFRGVLKKYEPVRLESGIFYKVVIKHINNGPIQTFLKDFSKKLDLGLDSIFEFPVRWNNIKFDTSDYERKTYDISFGEIDFSGTLESISVKHKIVEGDDIFEYSLEFLKEASRDTTDNLISEAYLNYKEEDEEGKMRTVEFEVDIELIEKAQQIDESVF